MSEVVGVVSLSIAAAQLLTAAGEAAARAFGTRLLAFGTVVAELCDDAEGMNGISARAGIRGCAGGVVGIVVMVVMVVIVSWRFGTAVSDPVVLEWLGLSLPIIEQTLATMTCGASCGPDILIRRASLGLFSMISTLIVGDQASGVLDVKRR